MEPNNKDSVAEIIQKCKRETKIHYLHNDGFFTGKFWNINHLEIGYSKMIHNPITILVEAFYYFYKKFRNFITVVHDFLFPRKPKIYVDKLDSYLTGIITHDSLSESRDPIHNVKVEFWVRTKFTFQFRKLGETYTDQHGCFHLNFSLRNARRFFVRSLRIDILLPKDIVYVGQKGTVNWRIFHTIFIKKKNLIGLGYNVHSIALPIWEYRMDTKVPRTYVPKDPKLAPEVYDRKRVDALIQQIVPSELTKTKHLMQIKLDPKLLTIDEIQADYPMNLTQCIEKKLPGFTRSDAWFEERIINGMNKATLMPDVTDHTKYHIKFWGVCHYDFNEHYALPDVDIELVKRDNALPKLHAITFTGPLNAYQKDPWQKQTFRPSDGEKWMQAKRVARMVGSVVAEVDEHFAGTHVNVEQYAIAAYRNLRRNPIATLLYPHIKEVSLINRAADKTIIAGYLPNATALTYEGLTDRVKDILGLLNWKHWKPMTPINEKHTYALAENLFWEQVGKFIDRFFDENEVDIKKEWFEVYSFSKDLVLHSAPVFGSDFHSSDPREMQRMKDRFDHGCMVYSCHHIDATQAVNGIKKVITPITKTEKFENDADFQNAKDVCKYIIMMATFSHTWINEQQYDDLGDIMYNCGGLRFGLKERGVIAPESDLTIAPDLTRATQMLWFTNFLSRTEYGFITRNEEHDVHPYLIELLLDKKADFAKLGVDIEAIESRTNI